MEEVEIGIRGGEEGGVITLEHALSAVRELLEARNRPREVTPAQTFEQLGFDSLDRAELFVMLEEDSETRLDAESALDVQTVRDLTKLRPLGALTI